MRLGMGLGLGNLLSGQPLTGFPNDFSFNFDGSNDYLETSTINEEFKTVSFWFKPDSTINYSTSGKCLCGFGGNAFNLFIGAGFGVLTNEIITLQDGSNYHYYASTSLEFSNTSWTHLAVVWNASSSKYQFYVNGVLKDTTSHGSGVGLQSNNPIIVGARSSKAEFFDGEIDEFSIWNESLSADDIAKIASKPVDFSKASTYATDRTANLKLWLRAGDKVLPEEDASIARSDFYTDFDSSNTLVNCGDDTSFDMTTSYTLMGWVNLTAITSATQFLFGRDDGTNRNYWIEITNSNGYVSSVNLGTSDTSTVGSACPVGVWTHICSSYDGANVKVYINGKLDVSESVTGTLDNDDVSFTIGARDSADRAFGGGISNVSLYKTALDAQTISQMAKSRFTPMRDNRFSVVDFDGSNDYIKVDANSSINSLFATGGTFSAWVNLNSAGETAGRIAEKGFIIYTDNTSGSTCKLNIYIPFSTTDGNWITTNHEINFGEWQHIAITYDGSSASNEAIMYFNGSSVAVTNNTPPVGTISADTADLYIGNRSDTARSYSGSMSSFALYSTAKSAEEIYALYSKGITYNESSESGLVGLWRMGDDTSSAYPTIADSSSNSNDGTITNGASDDIVQQMVAGYDMGAFESSSEELGAERFGDPTFSSDLSEDTNDSNWRVQLSGLTISDGRLRYSDSGIAYLYAKKDNSDVVLTLNKLYKLVFTIYDNTATFAINTYNGGSVADALVSNASHSVGTHTFYVTPTSTHTQLRLLVSSVSSSFSMDDFSVKEVLQSADANDTFPIITDVNEPVLGAELIPDGEFTDVNLWDAGSDVAVGTGISFVNGQAVWATSGTIELKQDITINSGKLYKVVLDIDSVTSGTIRNNVGSYGGTFNTAGIKTEYITGTGSRFYLVGFSGFNGVLNSVSVKEVFGNVGTMTNQDSADLVYSSVLPDQSFLATGVNSAYNFIDLDGGDQYIDAGALDSALVPPLSISMWVKGDSQSQKTLIQDDSIYSALLYTRLGNEISLYTASGEKSYSYTLDNTWIHIAVTQTASAKPLMYVNGSLLSDGDADGTPNPSFSNIRIGGDNSEFEGSIGQTAIWNKELSSTEVGAIYTLGRHGNLLDSYSDNLKGYWAMSSLDASTGLSDSISTIYDRSGNSNHGTPQNADAGDLASSPNAEPNGYSKSDTNRSNNTP